MNKLLKKFPEQTDNNKILVQGLVLATKIYSSFLKGNARVKKITSRTSSPKLKAQYLFSISQAAKFLGVSADTLRNWEQQGKIIPNRTKGGSRRYKLEQLKKLVSQKNPYLAKQLNKLPDPIPVPQKNFLFKPALAVLGVVIVVILLALVRPTAKSQDSKVLGVTVSDKPSLIADLLSPFINFYQGIFKNPELKPTPKPQVDKKIEDLSSRVNKLEQVSTPSTWKVSDRSAVSTLTKGVSYIDLIGKTIIDSDGRVYPSNSALASDDKPTIGTYTNRYYGIYSNRFELDSGGNLKVFGKTILGDGSADTIKFIGGIANDILPASNDEIVLGKSGLAFKSAQISAISGSTVSYGTATLTLINIGDGTAAAPALTFSSDADTGLWRIGSDEIALTTGGGAMSGLSINSAGNVGIGITNAGASLVVIGNVGIGATTSSNKLDVWGNARIAGNLTVDGASGGGGNFTLTSGQFLASNGTAALPSYSFSNLTNAGLWTNGDGLLLTTGGTNTKGLTITGAGNVGIGTTTPLSQLHISTTSTGDRGLTISQHNTGVQGSLFNFMKSRGTEGSPTAVASGDYGGVFFNRPYSGTSYLYTAGFGFRINGTVTTSSVPSDLFFYTSGGTSDADPYTNGTVRLLIDKNGNVGIGFTSPTANLHVVNTAAQNSFRVDDVANDTTPFIIDQNGNVGIGTTVPGYLLHLAGSIPVVNLDSASNDAGSAGGFLMRRSRGTVAVPTAVVSGDQLFTLGARGYDGTNYSSGTRALIGMYASENFTSGAQGTYLTFETTANGGTTRSEQVRITNSGNVGIGATSPNALLHLGLANNTTAAYGLQFGSDITLYRSAANTLKTDNNLIVGGTITSSGTQFLAGNGTASAPSYSFSNLTNAGLWTNGDGLLLTTGGSNTSGLTITGAGNVGIGTTSPANQLSIVSETLAGSRGIAIYQNSSDVGAGLATFYKSRGTNANPSAVSNGDYVSAFNFSPYQSSYLLTAGFGARVNGTVSSNSVPTDIFFYTTGGTNDSDPYSNNHIRMLINSSGNVGIGSTTPLALLHVGAANNTTSAYGLQFGSDVNLYRSAANTLKTDDSLTVAGSITQTGTGVNLFTGNIGIGTSAAGAALQVNGGGLFGWGTASRALSSGSIAAFNGNVGIGTTSPGANFQIDSTASTTNGATLNLNSLSSGTGLYLSSVSTSLSSGYLMNLDWSPGISTTATGDLMRLNIGANGVIGNLLNLLDNGSSIFSISQTQITAAIPASFNAPGDVSIAYDLNFTNPTASYIKSLAPFYIESGKIYNSSDLTLRTFNLGQLVLDTPGGAVLNQYQPWTLNNTSTMAWNIQDAANNTLMSFDTTNDRVGIGRSGPAATLAVFGNVGIGNSYGTYAIPANSLAVEGNVGVSNSAPSFNLDVVGTSRISGAATFSSTGSFASTLSLANGSSTTPGLNFTSLTGAGLWQSNNIISLTNGGAVNGLAINNTGNVGIGTTSPNNKLQVIGASVIGGNYGGYTAPANGLLVEGWVGVGTSAPSYPIQIGSDNTNGNGAYVTVGGAWSNGSSFEFKEKFTSLNTQDILNKINQLNISQWNYKVEPGIEHIGPIAEQFYSVFGLGNDNKHISTIDPAGVALAGIQGLSQEISNIKFQISNMQSQIATLSAEIVYTEASRSATPSAQTSSGVARLSAPERSDGGQGFDSPEVSLHLTPPDILIATGSAILADITVTSEATVSGMLTAYDAEISNSFKVFGKTVLGQTNIAGDITIDGILSITNGNSLSVLGVFYLQNGPLAGDIDLFNGKVKIDNQGKLSVQKLAVSSKTLGTVTISAGKTKLNVLSDQLTDKSKVFVAPDKPAVLGVSKDPENKVFTIQMEKALSSDLKVDWWIVDESNEN